MKQPALRNDPRSVSEQIIAIIATAEGTDPTALPPLYRTLDPESLDTLVESSVDGPHIEFEYYGYDVRVHGPEAIDITKHND